MLSLHQLSGLLRWLMRRLPNMFQLWLPYLLPLLMQLLQRFEHLSVTLRVTVCLQQGCCTGLFCVRKLQHGRRRAWRSIKHNCLRLHLAPTVHFDSVDAIAKRLTPKNNQGSPLGCTYCDLQKACPGHKHTPGS
jgi:hypothetical protein